MTQIISTHHRIAAAAVLAGALAGCSTPQAAAAPDGGEPIAVTVGSVAMADVAGAIYSGGVVQARTTATIAARIQAPVRAVLASPGDRVGKGQALVLLDGADLAASARAALAAAVAAEQGVEAAAAELAAAEASQVLARASHARIAGLQARGSATAQERDEATAALASADARVAAASARASQAAAALDSARAAGEQANIVDAFTTITAPFDGVITQKLVEPGNLAMPAMPLLRLEDTREFRLEVRVDESRIGSIRNGDAVPVMVGAATTAMIGTVAEVSRAVDADARAFLVKIALPEAAGLRSGEFGKARFDGTPRRALTVPPSAVVRQGQLTSVFVVDQGRARLRLVNLSESEVLAGLVESEVVILSPPAGVNDGARVSVRGQ